MATGSPCPSGGCLELGVPELFSVPLRGPLLPFPLLQHLTSCSTATAAHLHCPHSWRSCIPLSAGDLALVSDGGTPQPCHQISMPRTPGSQCQMEQLSLKSFFFFSLFFLTSKKLFPNKSPFIVMPISSHAEVLKHLGLGHCLLNLTGPPAIAFQQYELCLSLPRPALHFPLKIGLIYHHPPNLFSYLSQSLADMAWQRFSPLRLLLRLRKHEEDISREFVKYNSQGNMASRSCCAEGQNKYDQTKRKICCNYHHPTTSCGPYPMNLEGKLPLDIRSGD